MEKYPGHSNEAASDDDDDESTDSSDESANGSDSKQSRQSKSDERVRERDRAKHESDDQKKSEQDEPEPPLEALGDDEKKLVANQYVGTRDEEIRDELETAQPESAHVAELLANAALLEIINDKLNAGTPPTEAALNDAVSETIESLGIDMPDAAPETAEVQSTEPPGSNLPEQQVPADSTEADTNTLDKQSPETDDTVQDATTNPVNPVIASPNTNANNPNAQTPPPNPNLPPPLPPNPNFNPNQNTNNGNYIPPNPPNYGGGGNYIPPYGPNINGPNYGNPAVSPNTYTSQTLNTAPNRRKNAQYFLVGGLLGYLVGRRRGRIKTEKKLLPVQHKLEKQVKDLHASIAMREEKIRTLVREQIVAKPITAMHIVERLSVRKQRQTTTRTAETVAASSEKATETHAFNSETSDVSESPTVVEATGYDKSESAYIPKEPVVVESDSYDKLETAKTSSLAAAAESGAERTVQPTRRTEKVGRLVTLEQDNTRTLYDHELDELPSERPITLKVPERPKTIEAMTLAEVLVIAQRIPVERSNLKKLFEANRLSEKSLRRIAETYLRGERYEKLVKDNLLDKEVVGVNGVESFESKRQQHDLEQESAPNQSGPKRVLPSHQPAVASQVAHSSVDQNGLLTSPVSKPDASKSLLKKGWPLAAVIIIAILLLLLLLRR